MRYILALIPQKETINIYIHTAQMLFSTIQEDYLLSENSLPHITICQFECDNEQKANAVWEQIEDLNTSIFFPNFTGMSFVKGIGAFENYYWAELSVARDIEIIRIHQLAAEIIQAQQLSCLNDSGDLYRPHLTLARIRLSELFRDGQII